MNVASLTMAKFPSPSAANSYMSNIGIAPFASALRATMAANSPSGEFHFVHELPTSALPTRYA